MSKIYIIAVLLIISVSSNAQIKKGSVSLGGELFYYNEKLQIENLQEKYESGTIGISIGKAFKENSVAGFNFGFSPIKQTYYPNENEMINLTYKSFNIGAFFSEYKKLAKDLYFFGQLDGAFITTNQFLDYSVAATDVRAKERGGFISIMPGISYQVFKKLQLEITIPNILSIQYRMTKFESENPQYKNSTRNQLMFYSNLNNRTSLSWLGVGFRFIL